MATVNKMVAKQFIKKYVIYYFSAVSDKADCLLNWLYMLLTKYNIRQSLLRFRDTGHKIDRYIFKTRSNVNLNLGKD